MLFTIDASDYFLRLNDYIEFNGVTYKVETATLHVDDIADAIVPLTVDAEGNTLTSETLPGKDQSRPCAEILITLSVVP